MVPPKKVPWKKRREIPDEQVRDAADQFDDARLLLQRQPPGSGMLLPLINNAAVALELYLKSLCAVSVDNPVPDFPGLFIVTAKAEAKSHKLVDLLDSIPDDIRSDLENRYEKECLGFTLRQGLTGYEGLFATSRYVFEKIQPLETYPLAPLMGLCDFLRRYISQLEPRDQIEW